MGRRGGCNRDNERPHRRRPVAVGQDRRYLVGMRREQLGNDTLGALVCLSCFGVERDLTATAGCSGG